MKIEKRQRVLGLALLSVGILVLLNAVVVSFAANFHTGVALTYLLGGVLAAVGLLYQRLPKLLRLVFWILLSIGVLLLALLPISGSRDTATDKEDALIVLGAGIRGDQPSAGLQKRLDAAYTYALENPSAYIIVSGGQGPQETVSESHAMKKYLLQKGISEERIIEEDKSSSTEENFAFSKVLLDELLEDADQVAFVTNDYHIYRARQLAEKMGFADVTYVSASTPFLYALPAFLRECAAILHEWLFQ